MYHKNLPAKNTRLLMPFDSLFGDGKFRCVISVHCHFFAGNMQIPNHIVELKHTRTSWSFCKNGKSTHNTLKLVWLMYSINTIDSVAHRLSMAC